MRARAQGLGIVAEAGEALGLCAYLGHVAEGGHSANNLALHADGRAVGHDDVAVDVLLHVVFWLAAFNNGVKPRGGDGLLHGLALQRPAYARRTQYFFGHFVYQHQCAIFVHGNDALAHGAQNGVALLEHARDLVRLEPKKNLFDGARKHHGQQNTHRQRKHRKPQKRPAQPGHVGLNVLGHDAHGHSAQLFAPLVVDGAEGPQRKAERTACRRNIRAPFKGIALVAAHDMPADLPRFGVIDACALHVDEHNEFYAGNVGEHFHKIYHLLADFGFVRAHALDDGKRFCRKPGHVGDGFFRFFVAVFADEVRFCQVAEQYGRAQRQADHNDKFYKQAGIFDRVQHGKSVGAVALAGRPD